ncbi:hypothetical protein FHL15_002242 [Xylaria flabelliformis]|uniref:Major facilitator superfamily (MFS) profile domain-containing protein n=1 Tax=Xylaria flabelliformis TaxID=2512241 RepID=A0A553I9P8_9PEZI|nr:hypothetical protein FHL15_002242 [Xylaria flabelliformis]
MHLAENHSHELGSGPLSSLVNEPKVQINIAEPDVISSIAPAHLREKSTELPTDPSDASLVEKAASSTPQRNVSKAAGVTVIVTLAGISFLNTMGSGILIAALPTIARDVGLPQGLMLWPASVYALAAGALLLIFGAAADVVGAKLMWVSGSFLFIAFTLGIGFARTGIQLILFRTFQGVAIAMCLPTAVSLITNTFPKGSWRNMAFAMNGMGQPLGYSLGLVLGGIFTDTIGWRQMLTTRSFQEVEGVSPLQSSLRFLPHPIAGTATNIATAYLISRVEIRTLGVVSGVITMIAPILMATVRIGENYWTAPFFALLLSPLNPDVLFTASNLVISDAFPSDLQSVAGGVFNEVAQFGNAVGLAVTAAIASSVTDHSHKVDPKVALMDGYRAAFWTVFAATALVVLLIFFGLKRGGTVGNKDD